MEKYLTCSLKECSQNFPVLIFTDEIDREKYLKSIAGVLASLNKTFIDGETMIEQYIVNSVLTEEMAEDYNDNFFRFEVSNFIKELSKYQLVQRRTFQCNGCDDVCGTGHVMKSSNDEFLNE